MAGIVYLRTNRFEVRLEGITFKAKDFESLCPMDFLFPEGKTWARSPVVGLDVMRHPRDPSIVLLLLCFGVGCMILRFHLGDMLPEGIFKFLTDERISFVGFGIPEKKDLFPFEELGLTKNKVDIGYLAAKILNDSKYKRCELAELARKVLRIKNMIGLTDPSSFERHEQIKCAICQLFITSAIAMTLLSADGKKKLVDAPKKSSFLKNFNSLPLCTQGWLKLLKSEKEIDKKKGPEFKDQISPINSLPGEDIQSQTKHEQEPFANDPFHAKDDSPVDVLVLVKDSSGTLGDVSNDLTGIDGISTDDPSKVVVSLGQKPLKGILKCPSSRFERSNTFNSIPDSPPSGSQTAWAALKRANSKGYNVSFK